LHYCHFRQRSDQFFYSIFIERVVCQAELAIAPVSRLFNNNKDQLAQKHLVPPRVDNQRGTVALDLTLRIPAEVPVLPTAPMNISTPTPWPIATDLRQRAQASNPAGKKTTKPQKHFELYKMIPQMVELCYKAGAAFAYAFFFLVRDDFLVWKDGTDRRPTLTCTTKRWHKMVHRVLTLRSYDFSWLVEPREGCAEQDSISGERVKAATACEYIMATTWA